MGYDPAGHFEMARERVEFRDHPGLMELLKSALACNHAKLSKDGSAWHESGEPTEAALVTAAYKAWLEPDYRDVVVTEFPFNSSRKRMTTVVQRGCEYFAHVKGAPEVVLPRCARWLADGDELPMTEQDQQAVADAYAEMAEQGLRTLIVAQRKLSRDAELTEEAVENELTLLGIVGMTDPPRPEVPEAVTLTQTAGIRVFMITGDAAPTALAIARRVGLPASHALTGQELSLMDDGQLSETLEGDVVFARTTPEHKLRIVNLLQAQGHVVAMTGDGVNDAPALKKADIGVAMGLRGTEVAKGAADIVLTDDNFSSIVGAIEEGRRQYDNIQKFVRYLLSSNTGEIVAIFLNILLGGPLILLPVQILWMNLVTDGLTAVALGLEPVEPTVMQRKPRDPRQPILNRHGMLLIAGLGAYIGLVTLGLFHFYLGSSDPQRIAVAGTMAFTGIILIEKVNVLNFRSLRSPLSKIGLMSNPWIMVAIVFTIGLQVLAVYVPILQQALHTVPLGWSDWGLMFLAAAPILLVPEFYLWVRSRNEAELIPAKST